MTGLLKTFRGRLVALSVAAVGMATALGLLLTPQLPTSPLGAPGFNPDDARGNIGAYNPAAGADVVYDSPAATLQSLGVPFGEDMLPLLTGGVFNYTPAGINPRAIMVHNTDSLGATGCGPVVAYHSRPDVLASVHFCIETDGTVVQMVPLEAIAWHAGKPNNPNLGITLLGEVVTNGLWLNQYVWGIELVLDYSPTTEYAEDYPAMLASLEALVKFLAGQAGLPLDRQHIIAHRDSDTVNRVDPFCCWRRSGIAAGAAAFDAWVTRLSAPPPPPPPTLPPVTDDCDGKLAWYVVRWYAWEENRLLERILNVDCPRQAAELVPVPGAFFLEAIEVEVLQ